MSIIAKQIRKVKGERLAQFLKKDSAAAVSVLIVSIFYWLGLLSVPFHPDESTQLYMAADLNKLFTDPQELIWQPDRNTDLRMYYREVDPPLTRYIMGLGLILCGQTPLDVDWDWSQSWRQNQASGAFPSSDQLMVGRISVSILFPLSLFLAFKIGKRLRSAGFGWINMGLIATNALVLIHTRRAMAESALLFGILFSIWAILAWKKNRYWLAIPIALAFNAKYSALPLVAVGLVAIYWDLPNSLTSLKKKILHSILYMGIVITITFALNPFLWQKPVAAVQDAFSKRENLIARQMVELGDQSTSQVLETFGERGVGILAQLFIGQPAIADVGNYSADLLSTTERYSANPLHTLLSGWIAGSILLFLTIAGTILWIFWIIRSKRLPRNGTLIIISFFLQLITILLMIFFPFQRYYIPLVPYSALLVTFCLLFPLSLMKKQSSK